MSDKSLEQLTAQLLRKTATRDGASGEGLSRSLAGGDSDSSALVRRFLVRKGSKALDKRGVDAADLVSLPAPGALDTSGLDRQLARARMAVLAKKTPQSDGPSLSEMMAD